MNRGGETTKKHARMRTQIVHGRKKYRTRTFLSFALSSFSRARACGCDLARAYEYIPHEYCKSRNIWRNGKKESVSALGREFLMEI